MDLYLFDFDSTLYEYDFMYRLPELARASGSTEYRLASRWWAAGFETRAENGEWPTGAEYLAEFALVTESAQITRDEWAHARRLASTANPGAVDALRRAATLGTVSLLSNNPAPFGEALPQLAPDVSEILAGNVLVSYALGVRKPNARVYELALARHGAAASDTFFVDDNLGNVEGARALGITAHHFTSAQALDRAITEFSERNR